MAQHNDSRTEMTRTSRVLMRRRHPLCAQSICYIVCNEKSLLSSSDSWRRSNETWGDLPNWQDLQGSAERTRPAKRVLLLTFTRGTNFLNLA